MPFTAQELENVANSQLDYHLREGVKSQTIQEKPLLRMMDKKSKSFPNGKDNITVRVKGEYTTTIQGFSHDQEVTYGNPANVKTAVYPYKRIHAGIEVTFDELWKNGISVTDTNHGTGATRHSERELHALVDLLDDKIEDMTEGRERGLNLMYWRDGSQDSELVPGITSFILDDPTSATVVGGIDQSSNTWWRNRASLSINAGTPSSQNVSNILQSEIRQLRRYGSPKLKALAGADFIEALEQEIKAKGNYTDSGFGGSGKAPDMGVGEVYFKGVHFYYDPTLDDLSKAKYAYLLDENAIRPMHMQGEKGKRHNPQRPHNKYVLYKAMTDVCGLVCDRRNTSGVYSIA